MKMKHTLSAGVDKLRRNPRLLVRAALIVAAYLCVFILLDLFSQQFEELRGIVAWYPPAGLTYALLLVFGVRFTPAVTIAFFIGSLFIYRMPQAPYQLFLWAFIISLIYGLAAAFLRHRIHFDWHLRKRRDVTWLIGTAVLVSALLAVLSVSSSALMSSDVPRSEVLRSIFIWWIGEMVGVLTVTPFLLIYVMPWLKEFSQGQPTRVPARWSFPRPSLAIIGQTLSIALMFYWVFVVRGMDEFRPMYLMTLPLIWIVLDHGLKGTATGIMVLNFGLMLALWLFRFDLAHLGELQLLMIVICIVGLLMGVVVTERKQAEISLKEQEVMFSAFLENSPVYIFFKDSEIRTLRLSKNYEQLLGMSIEEAIGKTMNDLFPSDLAKSMIEDDKQILQDKKLINIVEELNGRYFETTKFPIILDDQHPMLAGFTVDITERKQAEEAITKQSIQRQRLLEMGRQLTSSLDIDNVLKDISAEVRTLLDASGVTIYMLDKEGKKLIPVLSYDPPFEDQVLSTNLDVDTSFTGLVTKARQGMIFNYADQQPGGYHIPGTPIEEDHLIIAPFIINEKAIGSLNIYRRSITFNEDDLALVETFTMYASTAINNARTHQDLMDQIVERKQAEEALAQSDSLRELLLDIITHDLKNPVGVIYALSETARQNMPENKFMEAIHTSSQRLMDVLNRTTVLSQATFGETIPKEALSLNTLINETVAEFESALNTAEMDLEVAIAPNLIIEANPLIGEVFKNYISNAIKYASNGKKIVIESILEDQTVMVCVKDFGKTIAKADREHVFQRQVQLENGKGRGRGLGLAIVKRIADAHNGEVWVEPITPKGNSFCLRIPR